MAYILRFPFRPQSEIAGLDGEYVFPVGALTARLRKREPYVVLEVRGFSTEQDAAAFIPVVWSALRWVLIERQLNTTCETRIQEITRAADPVDAGRNLAKSFGQPVETAAPVHGLGDEGWPSIYREDETVRFIAIGPMTLKVTTPVDLFLAPFQDAVGWKGCESLIHEPRFRLASDLLSAFHFESSANARLVTVGMALEVLAEPVEKHPAALSLIEEWAAQLTARKVELAEDLDATHALESLERELIVRREASKRSRIRRTALELGRAFGAAEAAALAHDAVEVYDDRSILVHGGRLPEPRLSLSVEKGRETLRQLLKAFVLLHRNRAAIVE